MAEEVSCPQPATIIGTSLKTTPELAAFANGTMLRVPEFNDTYKRRGHPSDNLAAVLSCADMVHASGKAVITATVLAYEVAGRFRDVVNMEHFDSSTIGAISSAVGAGKVLGLSRQQLAQAVNLAAASNIGLRQIRRGEVSMWKTCAWPNACRNGVFAARLAAEGMTGPAAIFEGKSGFFKAIEGPFELARFGGDFRIMETLLKRFPTGYYSQTAIDAALRIRARLRSPEDIAEVNIQTFDVGFEIMAGDPEKWRPRTSETADHSLPYVVGVALMYGEVDFQHFTEECLNDRALLAMVSKVRVQRSNECNQGFPETIPNIVEVVTRQGDRLTEKAEYHRGHYKNPMSDQEIEAKFLSLVRGSLISAQVEAVLGVVWGLEKVADIGELFPHLKIGS